MTTNDLISHLAALVAADPSVGDLPVYLNGAPDYADYPLEPSCVTPRAGKQNGGHFEEPDDRHLYLA